MLRWLEKNFPEHVRKMKSCKYYHDDGEKNRHHLEGDVWAHTTLAYSCGIKYCVPKIVLWAVILHDIGRAYTRRENSDTKRALFGDFEGVSCFVALEILEKTELSEKDKSLVLKIISYQYTIIDFIKYDSPTQEELLNTFKYDEESLYYLAQYVRCDLFGRKVAESELHFYNMDKIIKFIEFTKSLTKKILPECDKKHDLYFLVGPPCSRKSSWIKKQDTNFLIISRDDSMEFIGKKYNKQTFNEIYDFTHNNKDIKEEVDKHYKFMRNFVKKSKKTNIVIDNQNLKLKHRKEWISIMRETHNIRVIMFFTSFSKLKNCDNTRYMTTGKHIGEKTILEKLTHFIYPLYSEGIDEIKIIFNK